MRRIKVEMSSGVYMNRFNIPGIEKLSNIIKLNKNIDLHINDNVPKLNRVNVSGSIINKIRLKRKTMVGSYEN